MCFVSSARDSMLVLGVWGHVPRKIRVSEIDFGAVFELHKHPSSQALGV